MTKCLISGVTSGIGHALGRSLMADGHTVVGIGRNTRRLDELKREFGELFVPIALDLGKVEEIKSGLGDSISHVDSFVHCAGIGNITNLRKMAYPRFAALMNVNFFSFVEIVRLAVSAKDPESSMRIVGMSSAAARNSVPNNAMYGSCKAAMDGFVRCISPELIKQRVEINTLQPAYVDTEMLSNLKMAYGDDFNSFISSYQPMGIIPVEDIVEEIRFLLFKQGSKVTGTARYINGGRN